MDMLQRMPRFDWDLYEKECEENFDTDATFLSVSCGGGEATPNPAGAVTRRRRNANGEGHEGDQSESSRSVVATNVNVRAARHGLPPGLFLVQEEVWVAECKSVGRFYHPNNLKKIQLEKKDMNKSNFTAIEWQKCTIFDHTQAMFICRKTVDRSILRQGFDRKIYDGYDGVI